MYVEYFDQQIGAAHIICQSKSWVLQVFPRFESTKRKMRKNKAKKKKNMKERQKQPTTKL